jgi:hypothetical protein
VVLKDDEAGIGIYWPFEPLGNLFNEDNWVYCGNRDLDDPDYRTRLGVNVIADQYTYLGSTGHSACECRYNNNANPVNANCDIQYSAYVCDIAGCPVHGGYGAFVPVTIWRDNTTNGACHCFVIPSPGLGYDPNPTQGYGRTNNYTFSIKDVQTANPYIICSMAMPSGQGCACVAGIRYFVVARYELSGSVDWSQGGSTTFHKTYDIPDQDFVVTYLLKSTSGSIDYRDARYEVSGIDMPDTIEISVETVAVIGMCGITYTYPGNVSPPYAGCKYTSYYLAWSPVNKWLPE